MSTGDLPDRIFGNDRHAAQEVSGFVIETKKDARALPDHRLQSFTLGLAQRFPARSRMIG
jgi:hypothetical protein